MKEYIIDRAIENFLQYGFKSFTMDDLAHDLGMSKKTLYELYSSKTELVEVCSERIMASFDEKCDFFQREEGVIGNIFKMQKYFLEKYKITTNRPLWELKKYYPKIHQKVSLRFKERDDNFVEMIVNQGIKEGVFRDSIDVNFVKSFYSGIHKMNEDPDIFPESHFSVSQVLQTQMEFFIRMLANDKGIEQLEQVLENISK